ncbi:MAG: hypothetical protein ACFCU8_18435 [Thermosynechococcaceae cyanobacterium]
MSVSSRSLNLLTLFASVNAISLCLPLTTTAAPKVHSYNPALVALYTSSCTKQLSAKVPAKAKQACLCSVKEMQKQHPQGQAVEIVKKAKSSSDVDPSTGVPIVMSRYFAPCM